MLGASPMMQGRDMLAILFFDRGLSFQIGGLDHDAGYGRIHKVQIHGISTRTFSCRTPDGTVPTIQMSCLL
jgi:hypothetical protein